MIVHARFAAIKGIKPHEWIVRFLFGGAMCVVAGLISKKFGPVVGGLFLAFPAIFPAGASLVEAHEKEHKARAGFDGTRRGRVMAGIDAIGAAIGCFGLAAFAAVCWLCLPRMNSLAALALATLAWGVVSVAIWLVRKSRLFPGRRRGSAAPHAFRAS